MCGVNSDYTGNEQIFLLGEMAADFPLIGKIPSSGAKFLIDFARGRDNVPRGKSIKALREIISGIPKGVSSEESAKYWEEKRNSSNRVWKYTALRVRKGFARVAAKRDFDPARLARDFGRNPEDLKKEWVSSGIDVECLRAALASEPANTNILKKLFKRYLQREHHVPMDTGDGYLVSFALGEVKIEWEIIFPSADIQVAFRLDCGTRERPFPLLYRLGLFEWDMIDSAQIDESVWVFDQMVHACNEMARAR